ncbi:MAG: biotin/lipoate A/B protein ligase family protein [Promethearchaeati archaeon SRVP18_Atabeyarchaeia-1]
MTSSKKPKWRFLGVSTDNGASNMAVDEAIMLARSRNLAPNTVRLYRWKPPAVSIGYFLKIDEVADLDACRDLGVEAVRRMSGGGAVYHSENELTYSVIVKQDDPVVPADMIELYRRLSSAIASVPLKLGLEASFEPGHPGVCPNMIVAGKKISGNAQARKRGVVLQHGTLLLDCDLAVMARVLRIPFDLIDAKVTTLKRELGADPERGLEAIADTQLIESTLQAGFEESLGIKLVAGQLSEFEISEARKLREKYMSEEWTKMR